MSCKTVEGDSTYIPGLPVFIKLRNPQSATILNGCMLSATHQTILAFVSVFLTRVLSKEFVTIDKLWISSLSHAGLCNALENVNMVAINVQYSGGRLKECIKSLAVALSSGFSGTLSEPLGDSDLDSLLSKVGVLCWDFDGWSKITTLLSSLLDSKMFWGFLAFGRVVGFVRKIVNQRCVGGMYLPQTRQTAVAGNGFPRVWHSIPQPVPTIPVSQTRTGLQTPANHYLLYPGRGLMFLDL
ncbi:hypothetical protein B0H34DRAFT_679858 [Crassisporium funariophilum]|nr:hypothetical protein B0H34DRAFT_679858 [Crassisporium funariophilum]